MPYPCSHFYFDTNFGDRFDIKVKVTTWIGHHFTKIGADSLAENTPNAPDFICPICLPKPKSSGFQ